MPYVFKRNMAVIHLQRVSHTTKPSKNCPSDMLCIDAYFWENLNVSHSTNHTNNSPTTILHTQRKRRVSMRTNGLGENRPITKRERILSRFWCNLGLDWFEVLPTGPVARGELEWSCTNKGLHVGIINSWSVQWFISTTPQDQYHH